MYALILTSCQAGTDCLNVMYRQLAIYWIPWVMSRYVTDQVLTCDITQHERAGTSKPPRVQLTHMHWKKISCSGLELHESLRGTLHIVFTCSNHTAWLRWPCPTPCEQVGWETHSTVSVKIANMCERKQNSSRTWPSSFTARLCEIVQSLRTSPGRMTFLQTRRTIGDANPCTPVSRIVGRFPPPATDGSPGQRRSTPRSHPKPM